MYIAYIHIYNRVHAGIRQHTTEYASIRQHTPAYIWRIDIYIVGFMLTYVKIYVQRISTYSRVHAVPECWCAGASPLPTLPSLFRKSLLWVATTYTIPAGFGFHDVSQCWCAGLLGVYPAKQVLLVQKYLFDQYKSTNTGRAAAREGLVLH